MAFCAVTQDNVKNLNLVVKKFIVDNPESLKNFRDFTQKVMEFLTGKNMPIEKAITLLKYVPDAVIGFTLDRANRDILKKAGISIDAIRDVEDQFDTYEGIAKYMGLKGDATPIVIVNQNQLDQEAKITKHLENTKVTFDADVRIINGKKYTTRVTSIAKVGYEDPQDPEVTPQNAALKHGNTVDAIAKSIFDEVDPKFEDYRDLILQDAFETLVGRLKAIKSALQQQGFVFKTAVTLYNNSLGISGEADLIAINPEGQAYIMDFKTANQRFNETYLKNDTLTYRSDNQEVKILSKWKQYGTQGYIYAKLVEDQLNITPVQKTGIVGINISYDGLANPQDSKILKVIDVEIHNIPFSEVRSEMRGKSVKEMYEEYKRLEGQSLGPITEIKDRKPLPNRNRRRNLDRMATINEIAATDSQLQEEIDWFKSNPIGQDTLLRISGMVNTGLLGQWTLDGITIFKNASVGTVYHEGWHRFSQVFMSPQEKNELYKGVQKDAIRFRTRDGRNINTSNAEFIDVEEFLADQFAKYALNPKQYKYPTKNAEPKTLFEKIWAFIQRFFGSSKIPQKRTDYTRDISEYDREFAIDGKHYFIRDGKYEINGELVSDKEFFDGFNKYLDAKNRFKLSPIEIFQKLYTGRVSDYVPSVNNAYWGNLNSLAEDNQGNEIVSNERFPLYVRSMDYLIGKELRDAGKSFTAFKQSKKLQSQVLDNVFDILAQKYEAYQDNTDLTVTEQQADEIYSIFNAKRDFTRAYLKATAYETLKDFIIEEEVFTMTTEELAAMEDLRDEYTDEDDYDATIEDDSKPERFDRTGNEDSAFSVADDAIQDFFRTIPKIKNILRNPNGSIASVEYELNELGFPENHKFYDVFYKTKKMLSGSFDMGEMQIRMQSMNNQRIFPELSIVNEFIGKFMEGNPNEQNFLRSVQNVQFVQAFYHVMSMPEVPNMQLTQNYLPLTKNYLTFKPTMVSYRTASRNLSLKIIKTWEKNFKDRRGKQFLNFTDFEQNSSRAMSEPLYLTEDGKLMLNPFIDYTKAYTNSLESVTNPTARKNGLKDFWEVMGVTFNDKVYSDKSAVLQLIEAKNILIENLTIYRGYSSYEWELDAHEDFAQAGVSLDPSVNLSQIINKMPSALMDVYVKRYYVPNPVSFFNEKGQYSYIIGDNNKVVSPTTPMRFVFEDLATVEEKFGERVSSGSFRIEDKTKYPYYIPNQLLIITELINKLERTTQFADNLYLQNLDPIKNNWMKRSYFMKQMFDHNGARKIAQDKSPVRILVEDIASVRQVMEDNGNVQILEKAPRSLNRDEKFFMDILTMFKAGAIEIPRAETSSTMFTIRLSDYGKGKFLPMAIQETLPKGGSMVPEVFQNIVKDYFYAEIEKRQWFMKNDPNVKGANKRSLAQQFNVFEGILSQDLKDRIVQNLDKTPEEIFGIKGIEGDFRAEIESYFKQQITEIRPRFDALPKDQKDIISDTIGSKSTTSMLSLARAFILNHFILSEEFYQIYFGDLYFYKNAFKRGKYVTNTGNTFYIDDIRNEMLNGIQNSTMHSIFTGKKPGGKDFRFINTAIMNDVEMKSSYVSDDDNKNILLQGIVNARVASGALAPNTPEFARFIADTKLGLAKYKSINIADGQGIIGMDFYRNFAIITNIWDEKKEKEYERQKAIFRSHYDLYYTTDNNGNRVRMEGDELEAAKAADKRLRNQKPQAFFNPLKISYTGPQAKNGPTHPVFDKFSVRPIIPEMAIGKRDEDLMMQMANQDLDYVKFKSGSKVYQDSAFDWFKKIGEGTYDLNNFSVGEIPANQLFAGYLKHQLSTEGFKEENIFGSQFRKIVFGIKYSPMVRNNPQLVKYFTDLEKNFKQNVDDLIAVEQNDLFSLLGVTEANGAYSVSDMKKFLKLLETESIKRGVAINNIDYIQYDEMTKNAKYPIDYAFNRQAIQDLLAGLIDERLRRLKVNGSSLIQVSSAGTESKQKFRSATAEEIQRYGTTGLHYYHMIYDQNGKPIRTSTMGVKVSLSGDYRSLLNLEAPISIGASDRVRRIHDEMIELAQDASGEPLYSAGKIGFITGIDGKSYALPEEEALARLNAALKDPEWRAQHIDKLTLVGYRIPTQNINFTDHMEIMEFLPQSAGAIIIPPIELIVKSGSDFDIDKMNIMKPSIDDKGFVKKLPAESLDFISGKIREQVLEERELRTIRKQLQEFAKGANIEIEELEKIQRKVRLSMLDLATKVASEKFVNAIVANMQEGANDITPTEAELKDMDESTVTAFDMLTEYERVAKQFQDVDQDIQRLRERATESRTEAAKITNKDLHWFNRKRAYKEGRNNDLIRTLAEVMSHPYYFELLVTPSSAAMFEGFTNELIAAQVNMTDAQFRDALVETEGKLFDRSLSPQQASTYAASSEAFLNLLSRRRDLGGFAIQRTFADIFNFAAFSIAQQYSVQVGREYETKLIHTPLIAPQDRAKSLINGRLLMHGESVTGVPISKSFDETVSLTVDLAGSPAYAHMGITPNNRKHFQYLIHQKTDPKAVMWFLNQPILHELFKTYEDKRRKVSGYSLKHAIVELSLKYKILENPLAYKTGTQRRYEVMEYKKVPVEYDVDNTPLEGTGGRVLNPRKANQYLTKPYWDLHEQNLVSTDHFNFEDMDEAIRNDQTNTPLQKKILAYFASMTEEADLVMQLQFAENVDTTKYATLTSLIRNEENRRKIRGSDLFSIEQINKIEKESMIAPFDYTQKAKGIMKTLFPKLYTNRTIGTFAHLVNDVWGAKNIQIERISKIVENDYIEYIYKNYGRYRGQNLSQAFQPLLMNLDGAQDHHYFSYELNSLKADYPELLDIPFVSGLTEDVYFPPDKELESSYKGLDNLEIHNIFFLRNPDNPTFEKNIFTNNWRNLINFDPERLGLKEAYTEEDTKKISEFFHKLVYFSLYQAGLTNTGNGFSDLIPYEYWASFVIQAFDSYDLSKQQNEGLENEMLNEFEYRFRQMNPKINWRTKTRELDEINSDTGRNEKIPIDFFKNYYRGKDYLVTDDDLQMARFVFLRTDDEVADDIPSENLAKPENLGEFAPGNYVEFEGQKYILIKKLSPGVWQIYDPLREGSQAKIAARESRMTTLKEKGVVVQYGQRFFLTTLDNLIVDLEKNKRMTWSSNNAHRQNILKLAQDQQVEPLPLSQEEIEKIKQLEAQLELINNLKTVNAGETYTLTFEENLNDIKVKVLSISKKGSNFIVRVQNVKTNAEYSYTVDRFGYGEKASFELPSRTYFGSDEAYKKEVEDELTELKKRSLPPNQGGSSIGPPGNPKLSPEC